MKTILVSLAHLSRIDDVINMAASAAVKHDSHVIGLFPIPGPTIVAVAHPGGYMPLDDRVQKMYEAEAKDVRARFEDRMRRDGLNFEWRVVRLQTSDITSAIIDHGRESDLIILSRDEAHKSGAGPDVNLAADVVLGAGRPVLIVPAMDGKEPSFSKAVIGWNASRESCRAAFDCIPLLKLADDVHLTWVNPEKSIGKGGKLPGTELAAALARHDINVTTKGLSNRSKPGLALTSYARDEKADLLVIGAYGRSRLRERILGGATEHILRHTTIPVFMSN